MVNIDKTESNCQIRERRASSRCDRADPTFDTAKVYCRRSRRFDLLENSPFFSWMLPILGLQGVSNLVGIIEVTTAFSRPWSAFASVLGAQWQ